MTDLSNVVRMLIHQLDATRSYLLPSYCDEDEKARAVIAFAESALAAEPAFAASEPSDEDLADLSEVFNGDPLPAIRRALELWGRPTIAALAAEPPAPAPAVDGEREELAALINQIALAWEPDACLLGNMTASQLARAATLLREPAPAPVPVPVAGRPWERPGWCDVEGFLWLWDSDRRWVRQTGTAGGCNTWTGSFALPHWAIPQPPQGGEVP